MSELTEETAKELIQAIKHLATIIKPIPAAPAEPEKDEITPQQKKRLQKIAEKEQKRKKMEEYIERSFVNMHENFRVQARVRAENDGTAEGSTENYLKGLSRRELVYYERIKYPYHTRGNSKKKK